MKAGTSAAPFSDTEAAKTTPERYTPPGVSYATRAGEERKAIYEHSYAVRLTHWLNAVALFVMAGSGLRIYLAFPAFGDKLPPSEFFRFPARYSIGGWLGGALQWHFTFMWLFMGAGVLYVAYRLLSGTWRQVVFMPRDVSGVWPMFRHYFLFGPKPTQTESYNPLQKLAYTATILLGVLSTVTGLVLYKSAQLSFLTPLLGGYRSVRILHFVSLAGFLAFIPGHLIMVIVHGWNNFQSMLTGWNFRPEYVTPVAQSLSAPAEPEPVSAGTAAPGPSSNTAQSPNTDTEVGVPIPPSISNNPVPDADRKTEVPHPSPSGEDASSTDTNATERPHSKPAAQPPTESEADDES